MHDSQIVDAMLKLVLLFDHQLPCTIIDYHQLSFTMNTFKIFMVIDDSFPHLTMCMIVHNSYDS